LSWKAASNALPVEASAGRIVDLSQKPASGYQKRRVAQVNLGDFGDVDAGCGGAGIAVPPKAIDREGQGKLRQGRVVRSN
jgi:hypothetical protein